MNTQSPHFLFEQATAQDSDEILTILEDVPFTEQNFIALSRRPGAYASLKREGEDVVVLVAQIQTIIRSPDSGLRHPYPVCEWYPCQGGLFIRTARCGGVSEKFPILHRGYAYLRTLPQTRDVACYITTILEDNLYAQAVLEKNGVISCQSITRSGNEIFALTTGRAKNHPKIAFDFRIR